MRPATVNLDLTVRPVDRPCTFVNTWHEPRSGGRLHEGVDIVTAAGKPVYAVIDGVVSKVYVDAPGSRSGNGLRLARPDGTYYFYAHLQQFAPGVGLGTSLRAGDVIGYVGHTGNTVLNHLHFEVHPGGGDPVDPTPIVAAAGTCTRDALDTGAVAPSLTPAQLGAPTTTLLAPASRTTAPPPVTAPPRAVPTPTPTTTTTAPKPAPKPAPTTTAAPVPPPTAAPPSSAGAAKGLTVVGPLRVADSRFGTAKRLRANAVTEVIIARAGVPNSITAAQITVWSVASAADGFLTVFPCGGATPATSTLNFAAGQTVSASVFTSVTNGKVCVKASTATDIIIDVSAISDGAKPSGVIATSPFRAFDSTWNAQRLLKGKEKKVRVAGAPGMPAAASAATLTVTTSGAAGASSVQAYPCGGTPSGVPLVVGAAGQVSSAGVTIGVGSQGAICFISNIDLDLTVDVHIEWARGGAQMRSISPARLLDTRGGAAIGAGATREVAVGGVAGIPGGVTAAAITVTVAQPSSAAQVVVWPCGKKKPNTVVVSAATGQTVSGGATVGLGNGKLCVSSSAGAHVVVDVTGYAK